MAGPITHSVIALAEAGVRFGGFRADFLDGGRNQIERYAPTKDESIARYALGAMLPDVGNARLKKILGSEDTLVELLGQTQNPNHRSLIKGVLVHNLVDRAYHKKFDSTITQSLYDIFHFVPEYFSDVVSTLNASVTGRDDTIKEALEIGRTKSEEIARVFLTENVESAAASIRNFSRLVRAEMVINWIPGIVYMLPFVHQPIWAAGQLMKEVRRYRASKTSREVEKLLNSIYDIVI